MKTTPPKQVLWTSLAVLTALTQVQAARGGGLGLRSEITGSAPAGGVTLTHTVWNPTGSPATNVWLTNHLPIGVSFRGTNKWPIGSPGPTYPEPPPPPLALAPISPGTTFAPPLGVTGGPAVAIAITDFDRDGRPDLVVANGPNDGPVTVFRAASSTNLPAVPTTLPTPVPPKAARTIAVGDLDGDGRPDIICAGALGEGLWTYLQTGETNFVPGPTFDTFGVITAIEVMDLDGDGFDDLVLLDPANHAVRLLQNTTTMGTAGFMEVGVLPTPPAPTALGKEKKRPGRESPTLASLGRLYVTSDDGGGTVSVYIPSGGSDPANLFLPPVAYPCGPTPRAVVVGDLDGDGWEDIAVANGASRHISLLSGDASGAYLAAGSISADVTTSADALRSLDLDGDGRAELITGSAGAADCVVIPNSRFAGPLNPSQFGSPVHFGLPARFEHLGFDACRDGSQAGGFIAVGHNGPDQTPLVGGPSFSLLQLTHPGAVVAVPLGDLAPGQATGVSFDLEVRVPDATNSAFASAKGTGPSPSVIIPIKIPLRDICGSIFCVTGGVTQGMGGFSVSVVVSGTGYYYSNSTVTLPNGNYCLELPFSCGGVFPWDTTITITSPACPGQTWTFPIGVLFAYATLPPVYCNNCTQCTNVQGVLSLFSGSSVSGLLPVGSLDSQFSVGVPPFANPNPYATPADTGWLANGPNSQWVGPDPMFQSFAGVYCYTNSFYLPCTNGAHLGGQWTLAGEGGQVLLNGAATGISLAGTGLETTWHPFSLSSGFVVGWNTLVFCVTNPPGSAGLPMNPTGLRTEITGHATCCAGCTEIHCPSNQVVEVCTNGPAPYGQVVNYPPPAAYSHCGYITNVVCVPPSGSFFLLGTNSVICTATDSLGNVESCSFKVIVRPDFTAPILVTSCPPLNISVTGCPPVVPVLTNGLMAVDNCAGPAELIITQNPPPGTPLPGGQTTVMISVCDPAGNCTYCDVIINAVPVGGNPVITCLPPLTLLTCSNTAIGNFTVTANNYNGTIACTPPSGSAFPLGSTWVTCTATNNCGGTATCYFPITVQRPPWRFACLQVGIGIPFEPIGGAAISFSASSAAPGTPALNIIPQPGSPNSGVRLEPGPAQTIRFTTALDAMAPVGAGFDLFLPPDPLHPNDPPVVSIRSKGAKGYCVKMNKRFADEPGSEMRSYAVNTNGDLLDPITFTPAEVDAIGVCDIGFRPGVTNCHVTVEVNLVDGSSTVEFDGPVTPVTPTLARHKGWDGCIYGPDRPRPKPPKTARIIMIPPVLPPGPPITELFLYVSGWPQMVIEEPSLSARGESKPRRKWSDGHVTLMKAFDDDTVEFAVTSSGGGVTADLGHLNSFEFALQKFGTNPPPGEQLLTRTFGPIRGLTNRPPPPFLDAMRFDATAEGVACSADFSNLESPTVRVQVWNNGTLVAQRTGVPAELGQTLLTLSGWPERIGKLGGSTPCRTIKRPTSAIILPATGGMPPEVVVGNECRVLAETPPGTPHPDFYGAFEFSGTEGAGWAVRLAESTPAYGPQPLQVVRDSSGITVNWTNPDFSLQGAVDVTGPWFNLGTVSPLTLPPNHPARYFRLFLDADSPGGEAP